jgi:NAD(P)H dehydrogenase (quinone)
MGFDPCERAEHYAERRQPERFDVQAEQRHASDQGRVPPASPRRSRSSTAPIC